MKFITFILLMTVSYAAIAATDFKCKLDNDPKHSFTFTVDKLGTEEITFVSDEDEEAGPIKTTAAFETITGEVVDTLNGQGGDISNTKKGIFLYGDAVGCNFVDFMLYKNSGYKRGYLKASYHCADLKPMYTLVSCEVK